MRRHWNYFKYVCRHKWFVWVASRHIGASLWLAVIHDLSKFSPAEWIPYAHTFYNADGTKRYAENLEFAHAWNRHQKRNPHHWQYWLITWDRGNTEALDMPVKYIYEMVADWMGAGRAITGRWEARKWYEQNKDKIIITDRTRETVEAIFGIRPSINFAEECEILDFVEKFEV